MSRKNPGFTLIELLVVIVVIAILAAISIVSYKGVQDRAYNAAVVDATKQWVNVLNISYIEGGTITLTDINSLTSDSNVCLGSADNYPAKEGYSANQCERGTHTAYTSQQLLDAINARVGKVSTTTFKSVEAFPGDFMRGIVYDSGNSYHDIYYNLKGNKKPCVVANSTRVTYDSDANTVCRIRISDQIGGYPIDW